MHRCPVEQDGDTEGGELQHLGTQLQAGIHGGITPGQAEVTGCSESHGLLARHAAVPDDPGGPLQGRPHPT